MVIAKSCLLYFIVNIAGHHGTIAAPFEVAEMIPLWSNNRPSSQRFQHYAKNSGDQLEPDTDGLNVSAVKLLEEINPLFTVMKTRGFVQVPDTLAVSQDMIGDGITGDRFHGNAKRLSAIYSPSRDPNGDIRGVKGAIPEERLARKRSYGLFQLPRKVECDIGKISITTLLEYIQYGRVCGTRVSNIRFGLGGK